MSVVNAPSVRPGASQRCAAAAKAAGLSPLGTVTGVPTLLLVEWPLPWPAEPLGAPGLEELAAAVVGRGPGQPRVRIQLVTPVEEGVGSRRRVICYTRPTSSFAGFRVDSIESDATTAAQAAAELLLAPIADDDLAPAESWDGTRDVLVCGHGSRDVCCGSAGTRLARSTERPGVRIWRTSHLGGHRFAPTAAVLPEGTVWGHLDDDAFGGILDEALPPELIRRHFRGSFGLSHEAAHAVEREALCHVGWRWLAFDRDVEEVAERGPDCWMVRVRFRDPSRGGSASGVATATVSRAEGVVTSPCGQDGPLTVEHEWSVEDFAIHLTP